MRKPSVAASLSTGTLVLAFAVACGQKAPDKPATTATPGAALSSAAAPTAAAPAPPLPGDLAPIVDAYRKIIVLLEGETALDANVRPRAELVGRLLFQENHQRVSLL